MTKQEQIEEMTKERNEIKDIMKLLDKCVSLNPMYKSEVASVLYGNNYRKLPEDSVVLSREEYEMLKSLYDVSDTQKAFKEGYEKGCETCEQAWDNGYNDGYESGKEDGVREFAEKVKEKYSLYDDRHILYRIIDELLKEYEK